MSVYWKCLDLRRASSRFIHRRRRAALICLNDLESEWASLSSIIPQVCICGKALALERAENHRLENAENHRFRTRKMILSQLDDLHQLHLHCKQHRIWYISSPSFTSSTSLHHLHHLHHLYHIYTYLHISTHIYTYLTYLQISTHIYTYLHHIHPLHHLYPLHLHHMHHHHHQQPQQLSQHQLHQDHTPLPPNKP